MRCELEVPGGEVGARSHLKARTIAIIPRRRGMHLDFAIEFELGDAPQVLAQDVLLDFELMLVGGVLVVASAAAAKMRAGRLNAVRRWFHDCRGMCASEARFFFRERRVDFLSGKNKRNENGLAASAIVGRKASESVAAIDELFNV